MESENKNDGKKHTSSTESTESDDEDSKVIGVGAAGTGRKGENKGDDSDDEESTVVGVGAAGRKCKNKKSSSSSSQKNNNKSSPAPKSTKRFTKSDDEWAKDLPSHFTKNCKDWYQYLSAAIKQGVLSVCWAVAIARCVQALFAIKGIRVELSPQHLINNITGKNQKNGQIIKYEELSKFLMCEGLVLEQVCKFSGDINQTCPKECSKQTSEDSFYKIKEFNLIKRKDVKEEDLIQLVNQRPVIAIIDSYNSFMKYKSGIYKGSSTRRDTYFGRHAVLVVGFDTTDEGEHYWLIQNSYGKCWGEKGIGKIIRKCSQKNGEPSLFVSVIDITV